MLRHGIDLDTEAIRTFRRRWRISELCVLGSILRADFGPDSDVDFLASYDRDADWDLFDHFHMEDELAAIIGRNVQIVDREAVVNGSNRVFRQEVLATAEPINDAR